jgi:hypothetical protein
MENDDEIEYVPGDDEPQGAGAPRPHRGRYDAELANVASVVLMAVGTILLMATCWRIVRYQQSLDGEGFIGAGGGFATPGPSLSDRLDGLATSLFGLGEAGILVALSIGLRALTGVLDRQSAD